MRFLVYTIILILLSFFLSCDIINPKEEIPTYISCDTALLTTDYYTQGSNAHNITDAWIYVNSKLIGVFEMPFSIPVLASGANKVEILPGIKNNGVAASRVVYPFYEKYTLDTVFKPYEILKITPSFEYRNATFALIEDFEDLGIAFAVTSQSDTNINLVSGAEAFEGNSMSFSLDSERSFFECRTTDLFVLSYINNVYLEMSFKCNDYFEFGLFARKYSGGADVEVRKSVITLNPTNGWKTIYIKLNDVIAMNSDAYDFRLYFACSRTKSSPEETTHVYIDNVKLIY
ncbi:MAG: hypothetical protein GX879_03760 [Bacteroidales bacterium]|nr:hypothetical protein [Bacteroidales bacterium]